jgi:hypothetical protein
MSTSLKVRICNSIVYLFSVIYLSIIDTSGAHMLAQEHTRADVYLHDRHSCLSVTLWQSFPSAWTIAVSNLFARPSHIFRSALREISCQHNCERRLNCIEVPLDVCLFQTWYLMSCVRGEIMNSDSFVFGCSTRIRRREFAFAQSAVVYHLCNAYFGTFGSVLLFCASLCFLSARVVAVYLRWFLVKCAFSGCGTALTDFPMILSIEWAFF